MTSQPLEEYLDQLGTALELRDTPQDRVDDVLRQVRSHIDDTGEDPRDAFGPPGAYAAHFAPRRTTRSFWLLLSISLILSIGGGLLFSTGLIGVVGGRTVLWGVDAWLGVVVGAAVLIGWAALIGATARRHRRHARP